MKKFSKILSIILSILMIISLIPITASAYIYSGTCGANLTWTFDGETGTLTISGVGDMENYLYSNTNYSCNRPWENYVHNIKTVIINNGVTSIGDYAFDFCDSLTDVTIPDSVLIIGDYSFDDCDSLTSITIPNSVTTIGEGAFSFCDSLSSVSIGNSVTTIGNFAFEYCDSLTSIVIPDSTTIIGDYVFVYCHSLTSISVDNGNQYYASDENGVLFNKEKTTLIQYPIGNTRISYTIPDSVTTIGNDAFCSCDNLTSISIGDNVITIGDYAFSDCDGLTSVIIPKSVIIIGFFAFRSCNSLTNIIFSDSVTEIGNCAFYNCNRLKCVFYSGTKDQWKKISIGLDNSDLTSATIHYNCQGYIPTIISPTCTSQGNTMYTCACGDTYVEDYVDALGHSYSSEITIPATHLAEGVKTLTCTVCGDSYTEIIEKNTEHNYESIITPPTCTEQGYTTYICDCGDSYITNYESSIGHDYDTGVVTIKPTCTTNGIKIFTCQKCGYAYSSLEDVEAFGHTPANAVEENYVAPTCTEKGSKDIVVYCSVCDEEIIRDTVAIDVIEHKYNAVVTPATCEQYGYVTYVCECGDSYIKNMISPTGHADNDGDGKCDTCPEILVPTIECECNCHKSGISKFFFNLIIFFQKLFGSNQICNCGVTHY